MYQIGFSFSHVVDLTGFLGLIFRGWLPDGTVWCSGIDVHYMRGYITCYTRLVAALLAPSKISFVNEKEGLLYRAFAWHIYFNGTPVVRCDAVPKVKKRPSFSCLSFAIPF